MKSPKKFNILISCFLFFSCAEQLDFKQLKDYTFNPEYNVALSFFSITKDDFYDDIRDIFRPIEDVVSFELFEDDFLKESLVSFSVDAEISNTLENDINISIELLSRRGEILYTFSKMMVKKEELDYSFSEEVIVNLNENVLDTRLIRVTVELGNPNQSTSQNSSGKLMFKSSVNANLESSL